MGHPGNCACVRRSKRLTYNSRRCGNSSGYLRLCSSRRRCPRKGWHRSSRRSAWSPGTTKARRPRAIRMQMGMKAMTMAPRFRKSTTARKPRTAVPARRAAPRLQSPHRWPSSSSRQRRTASISSPSSRRAESIRRRSTDLLWLSDLGLSAAPQDALRAPSCALACALSTFRESCESCLG